MLMMSQTWFKHYKFNIRKLLTQSLVRKLDSSSRHASNTILTPIFHTVWYTDHDYALTWNTVEYRTLSLCKPYHA